MRARLRLYAVYVQPLIPLPRAASAAFLHRAITNFISPMDAIAPNSDPKGPYWTTSPTVSGGLCQKGACRRVTVRLPPCYRIHGDLGLQHATICSIERNLNSPSRKGENQMSGEANDAGGNVNTRAAQRGVKSNKSRMNSGSTSPIGTHCVCDLEAEAAAAAAQRNQRRLEPLERATCLQCRQPG